MPGPKSSRLIEIAKRFPDIPIPPLVQVPPDLLWSGFGLTRPDRWGWEARKLARQIGYPLIIRSDFKHEDGLGTSFAGLFQSEVVRHEGQLLNALRRVRQNLVVDTNALGRRFEISEWREVMHYAEDRGVAVLEAPIDVFFQKYVESRERVLVTEHPNRQGHYFIDVVRDSTISRGPQLGDPMTTKLSVLCPVNRVVDVPRVSVDEVIMDYDFASTLSPGVVGQVEATVNPYSFVQWRPIFAREYADFSVEGVARDEDGSDFFEVPQVIGVTPRDGVFIDQDRWEASEIGGEHKYVDDPLLRIHSRRYMRKHAGGLPPAAAWQKHEGVREFERIPHIAFTRRPLSLSHEASLRYWSDGSRGLVQILD